MSGCENLRRHSRVDEFQISGLFCFAQFGLGIIVGLLRRKETGVGSERDRVRIAPVQLDRVHTRGEDKRSGGYGSALE